MRQRLRPLAGISAGLGALFVLLALFLPLAEPPGDHSLLRSGLEWMLIPFLAAPLALPALFALWDSASRLRALAPLALVATGVGVLVNLAQIETSWRLYSCAWSRCPQVGSGTWLETGAAFDSAALGALLIVLAGGLLPLTLALTAGEGALRRRRLRSLIFPPS